MFKVYRFPWSSKFGRPSGQAEVGTELQGDYACKRYSLLNIEGAGFNILQLCNADELEYGDKRGQEARRVTEGGRYFIEAREDEFR